MQYERLTDKDMTLNLNINPQQDMTRHFLFVQRLWELENQIDSGGFVKFPCALDKKLYVICSCKDIEMICDDNYETGTGTIECPFESQCKRQDCEDKGYLQVFETCVGYIYFDNETFELCAIAEHTHIQIEIGKNAFYDKTEAEQRLKELQNILTKKS